MLTQGLLLLAVLVACSAPAFILGLCFGLYLNAQAARLTTWLVRKLDRLFEGAK